MAKQRNDAPAFKGRWNNFAKEPEVLKSGKRSVIKRLWRYMSAYRKDMVIGMLASLGIVSINVASPYLIGLGIDRIANGDIPGLMKAVSILFVLNFIISYFVWLQGKYMTRAAQGAVRDLRRDLFARIQRLPLRYFDSRPKGDLMSRMTNDADTISSTLGDSISQLITSVCFLVGTFCVMLKLNVIMACICMTTMPLVFVTGRIIAAKSRKNFKKRQADLGVLNSVIQESIGNNRAVISLGLGKHVISKTEAAAEDLKGDAIRALIAVGVMGPCMNMFRNLNIAITAGAGAYLAAKDIVTVGMVATMITYAERVSRPLNEIANVYGTIQSAIAGAARVFEVLDEPRETDDETDTDVDFVKGDVIFDNVTFGYDPDKVVLKNISFDAPAGKQTALVGTTGAGKTTVINLLTRFYDIDSGVITVDGKDIRDINRDSLRSKLGIVLQDTYLFTGTVADNIRYGKPDATDEEVREAARLANAAPFIEKMPLGYRTVLADSGSNLSHGQRQLLAIARTILADPSILILDEATSSVDTLTEKYIHDAFRALMKGRTTFIIAHRLNTIREADEILVLENGEIVERGSHGDLISAGGTYARLYKS
ncbi:MAG: ABC transporter ATP-binding protein [Abditibacteriota bacterium]|nr:ABC transporter ATP-binding protein [Abditibacteriota bacterium]